MKNYSFYKKTDEVYISSEFAFPIAVLFIASLITYGLLYFFGIAIAVVFNIIISFIGNFYFYYYGKSSTDITLEFLIRVVLVSGLFLFIDYGAYALVVYQNTGVFNKLYFYLWLAIILGVPVLYYIFQYSRYYFKETTMAVTYLKVPLTVHHDRELFTVIDAIQFVNSSNRTMSDIKLEKPLSFYSEDELLKLENDNSVHHYVEKDVFYSRINMPFEADTLFMSWYSIIEDKYYDIEVSFPFEKLVIEQEKYPTNVSAVLRGKKTKPLNLHIHANGGIRLFNADTVLIDISENIPTVITEEERNKKIELHRYSHGYYCDQKAFSSLIEKIKSSDGIEERFLIKNKLIPWGMTVSGLKGRNYLEMFDVSFSKYKIEISEIETAKSRFLPKKIEIFYRGNYLYDWLTLRINTQKLYHFIQKITDGNEEIHVTFEIAFEDSLTDLNFRIIANEKAIVFNDWKTTIHKDRKQDMDDHLLDIDEDQQKRTLYKDAWDLVTSKQYDLAQEKCDAIKAIDPRFGFAYFLEVRLLWYKEGYDACYAKKDYFIAKTQHEPLALAHMYNNYGCLYDQELHYDESLSYFEKAILSNPKEGIYVCNLAEIYCKLNNSKKALEAAEKAKKLGHESSTVNAILESKGRRYS